MCQGYSEEHLASVCSCWWDDKTPLLSCQLKEQARDSSSRAEVAPGGIRCRDWQKENACKKKQRGFQWPPSPGQSLEVSLLAASTSSESQQCWIKISREVTKGYIVFVFVFFCFFLSSSPRLLFKSPSLCSDKASGNTCSGSSPQLMMGVKNQPSTPFIRQLDSEGYSLCCLLRAPVGLSPSGPSKKKDPEGPFPSILWLFPLPFLTCFFFCQWF